MGINFKNQNNMLNTLTSLMATRFMEHIANYGISYGTTEEFDFRMALFAKRDAAYAEINADPENTFTVGHNMFSTLTQENPRCGPVRNHQPTKLSKLKRSTPSP